LCYKVKKFLNVQRNIQVFEVSVTIIYCFFYSTEMYKKIRGNIIALLLHVLVSIMHVLSFRIIESYLKFSSSDISSLCCSLHAHLTIVPDIFSIVCSFHAHFKIVSSGLRLKHYFPSLIWSLDQKIQQLIVAKLLVMTPRI
jgi:hypothetical protein